MFGFAKLASYVYHDGISTSQAGMEYMHSLVHLRLALQSDTLHKIWIECVLYKRRIQIGIKYFPVE